MRRYPNKMELVRDMPGRGTVTFLIIVNVAVWFERSLHAKELGHSTQDDFYGILPAVLQTNINLPLLLFFRLVILINDTFRWDPWGHHLSQLSALFPNGPRMTIGGGGIGKRGRTIGRGDAPI